MEYFMEKIQLEVLYFRIILYDF